MSKYESSAVQQHHIGSRVQHQLRAHTPDDAKALKATVSTYPISGYNLADVLTSLAIGEAIITVMNEKGAPSPVAWTRLRAPQGSMAPTPNEVMQATVNASPLLAKYGTPVDPESAREILAAKMNAAAAAVADAPAASTQSAYDKAVRDLRGAPRARATTTRTPARQNKSVLEDVLGSRSGQTIVREVLRGIFSTLKRN